ncbi:multisubunit sodium/proton antiporter, MrpB subunit [Mariniphaga anaerophila]|uniref:Multisubunit sodium/proton antiporter, MrpB subunit n=1 Tax=Mariniphaga anaerophila TaxID=1484053 RepID=A0A1M5CZU9_9BACT|nr:MnhB domain-containing protein [Mariniphaga anaerophila]SHF60155.1 multisubunit sodium/proton antiporter, MrpB subunit [Mariniphaga anaerophila]
MNSVILQLAAKYLRWLLISFAVLALLRGHNNPGGGFIGGLMAGLAIVYKGFAFNAFQVKEKLLKRPERYMGLGLFLILLSFIPSVFAGKPLMTGIWITVPVPFFSGIKLGTPFLFDIGVFFTVIGVTLLFVFSLTQKK